MVQFQFFLSQLGRWLEYALITICTLLLCFLVGSVFWEVITRYVFRSPSPWTEEIAQFILVWFSLLAAAVCARRGMHFAIRSGVLYFGDRTRWLLRQSVNILVIILLAIIFKYSYAYLDIVSNQSSMATEINMRIPYAGVPAGIGAVLFVYLLELADAVLSVFTGQRFSEVEAREEEVYRELQGEALPELPVTSISEPH